MGREDMDWWNMQISQAERQLQTDRENGLRASEVSVRQALHGKNRLEQKERKSILRKFLAQFSDFMILLLLGAAVVSFVVSYWNGEKDFMDSAIIIAIVLLNAFLGIIQESKGENCM